jgi:hypothetical protein
VDGKAVKALSLRAISITTATRFLSNSHRVRLLSLFAVHGALNTGSTMPMITLPHVSHFDIHAWTGNLNVLKVLHMPNLIDLEFKSSEGQFDAADIVVLVGGAEWQGSIQYTGGDSFVLDQLEVVLPLAQTLSYL